MSEYTIGKGILYIGGKVIEGVAFIGGKIIEKGADIINSEMTKSIVHKAGEGFNYITSRISRRNNNENIELRRGQKRTGLIHIITRRYEEKVLNKKVNMPPEQAMKEISALSYLIADSLDKGELKQTPKGNWEINQNGIQSIITKDKNGKFVLTGYEFNDNIEVARNSINAVIAQYGDTPEFLGVYAQVGAALTSYGYNITSQNSPVNEQSNSSLEQSTLEKAADLLKNMNFNSANYKDLLEVINKISSMNGLENLEVPKEPESIEKVAQAGDDH